MRKIFYVFYFYIVKGNFPNACSHCLCHCFFCSVHACYSLVGIFSLFYSFYFIFIKNFCQEIFMVSHYFFYSIYFYYIYAYQSLTPFDNFFIFDYYIINSMNIRRWRYTVGASWITILESNKFWGLGEERWYHECVLSSPGLFLFFWRNLWKMYMIF